MNLHQVLIGWTEKQFAPDEMQIHLNLKITKIAKCVKLKLSVHPDSTKDQKFETFFIYVCSEFGKQCVN